MPGRRVQVVLGPVEEDALRDLMEQCVLSESEVVRAAIRHAGERLVEPGDEEWLRAEARARPPPEWWPPLADELDRMHDEGRPVVTKTGVSNFIVGVDKGAGRVELNSKQSHSGLTRTITLEMLENAESATGHSVIVRRLRAMADELLAVSRRPAAGWAGPYRIAWLLDRCLDETQPWPPEDLGVYLVSRQPWKDEPTAACEALYVGSTTDRSARFATRIGDLIADMFGFFGPTAGHCSGGQRLWDWCHDHRVKPGHLYLAWYAAPKMCLRCEQARIHAALGPTVNPYSPRRCTVHPSPLEAHETESGRR